MLKLDLTNAMLGINNRDLGTFKVGTPPLYSHFSIFNRLFLPLQAFTGMPCNAISLGDPSTVTVC